MNNFNSEWRIWAQMVAINDMIFVVIQLLVSLLLIYFAGAATAAISNVDKVDLLEAAGAVAWILWFVAAICVIATGFSLWFTVQLLKATELGRELKDAYNLSKRWQYVNLLLIVLTIVIVIIILCIVKEAIIFTIVAIVTINSVLIRIIFMYIVHRFMQEIQVSLITTPHQMTQKV